MVREKFVISFPFIVLSEQSINLLICDQIHCLQSSGPEIYVGNKGNQRTRDAQAYYGHCYADAIAKLREQKFSRSERGVPVEYYTWERIVIDECHE